MGHPNDVTSVCYIGCWAYISHSHRVRLINIVLLVVGLASDIDVGVF